MLIELFFGLRTKITKNNIDPIQNLMVVDMLDWDIIVSKFEFMYDYVHFQANTFWKRMISLTSLDMG